MIKKGQKMNTINRSDVFLKAVATVLCLLLVSTFICSCDKHPTPATLEIVMKLCENEIGLPAGNIYSTVTSKGEDGHMSSSLLSAIFGGSLPEVSADWIECSVFLPLANHPCEFTVIHCSSQDAAEDTARLLSHRLLSIKNTKEEWEDMLGNAKVIVYKNHACLLISSDTAAAEKLVKTMLG